MANGEEGSKFNSRKFQLTLTSMVGFLGMAVLMQVQGAPMDGTALGIGLTGILGQYGITNVWEKKG